MITDESVLLEMRNVATRRIKEIAAIIHVLEDERNVLVEVGRTIDNGLEDIKIAKGKIFKEPVPVAPSTEITEALGKINEQAIQEYERQTYARDRPKEKTGYATLAQAKPVSKPGPLMFIADESASIPKQAYDSIAVKSVNLATKPIPHLGEVD